MRKFKIITATILTTLSVFNTNSIYAQTQKSEDKQTKIATVNVDKLNIRKGPSTNYDIIGDFEFKDKVKVISIKNGWYKIKLEDGNTAWTNGKYINLDGKISINKLNVRTGPSVVHEIVEVKGKEIVKIIKAEDNGWYEIELEDGKIGYVCGKYVDTEAKNLHDYSDLYNEESESLKINDKSNSKEVFKSESSNSNVVTTMTVSATAYSGDGITSTGKVPQVGRTIAVDPKVIPYGTRVYIPALGQTYIAEDCGGAIKGNKIDIFMSSEEKCISWGVRNIEIKILK